MRYKENMISMTSIFFQTYKFIFVNIRKIFLSTYRKKKHLSMISSTKLFLKSYENVLETCMIFFYVFPTIFSNSIYIYENVNTKKRYIYIYIFCATWGWVREWPGALWNQSLEPTLLQPI